METSFAALSSDVFLPIEIVSREYSGHILLAAELASRGRTVVVGHKGAVAREMASSRFGGLLIYKTARGGDRDTYWKTSWASGGGSQVFAAQDPEAGIIYLNFQNFFEQRPIFRVESPSRGYFCFGNDDYSYLMQHFPDYAEKFFLTGAPRISLWGKDGDVFYKQDAEQIRDRYGRFILFASSGGFVHERYLRGHAVQAVWAAADEAHHFAEVARNVARDLDVEVIVRPHPADSWEAWSRASHGMPNLHVSNAFDLATWTRHASAVVHPGISTAALEAVCAHVPAISTHSNRKWLAQWETVPDKISYNGSDHDTLMGLLGRALEGNLDALPTPEASLLLRQKLLHPLSGASTRIADTLDRIAPHDGISALPRISKRTSQAHGFAQRKQRTQLLSMSRPAFKREPLLVERVRRDLESAQLIIGRTNQLKLAMSEPSCFRISQ